ncbi:hypothetical protein TeGR_g442 [Tetraparma gracilis]|nr:hypothetical protein TeGR_g442 [Tetraparma gracilis]
MIVIHINDEARSVKKDFTCDRTVLLTHMKYFQSYVKAEEAEGGAGQPEIDISVHCDVNIFEFLVKYMHNPHTPPPFQSSTVVSILISSEFLQMTELCVLCLRFIARNLEEILKLPLDLSCISDPLCAKLAKLTPAEVLVGLSDPKGKLLPRLYKKRLEVDFRERSAEERGGSPGAQAQGEAWAVDAAAAASATSQSSCLQCCRYCGSLFPESEVSMKGGYILCESDLPAGIGFRGEITGGVCEPVDHWSLTTFVASLRRQHMQWSEIYWMLWSAAHMLRLKDGGLVSADAETLGFYHPKKATFGEAGSNWGVYSCCGGTAVKFNPWEGLAAANTGSSEGCTPRPLALAPLGGAGKAVVSTAVPSAGRHFYNDENRVRVAQKARKALGPGYSKKFREQVKDERSGDATDADGMYCLKRISTQSLRFDEEVQKFSLFVAAPGIHRSPGAGRLGGGGTKFVGAEGFIRYAAAVGVAINPERYMFAVRGEIGGVAEGGGGGGGGGGAGTGKGSSTSVLAASRRAAALHEPFRGLDASNRAIMGKAVSGKAAAGMPQDKKAGWYRDCQKESDEQRLDALCAKLAALRGDTDAGGWPGAAEAAGPGGAAGGPGAAAGAKKAGERGKARRAEVRGSTWRKSYSIAWNTSQA